MLPVTCTRSERAPRRRRRSACRSLCAAISRVSPRSARPRRVRAYHRYDLVEIRPFTTATGTPRRCAARRKFGHRSDSATTTRRGSKRRRSRSTTGEKSKGKRRTRWRGKTFLATASPLAEKLETTIGTSGRSRSSRRASARSSETSPADAPCSQIEAAMPSPAPAPKRDRKPRPSPRDTTRQANQGSAARAASRYARSSRRATGNPAQPPRARRIRPGRGRRTALPPNTRSSGRIEVVLRGARKEAPF